MSTHRRECECEECLREYGDYFEAKRLIDWPPDLYDREDFDAWVELDPEPYESEVTCG
jgi:hypothetical protein